MDSFAAEEPGIVTLEQSETMLAVRMSEVTTECSKPGLPRTDVYTQQRTCRVCVQVVPESMTVRPSCVVACHFVVRMLYPETSWQLVSVLETPAALCLQDYVVGNLIVGL
jgi:hypothetical protein